MTTSCAALLSCLLVRGLLASPGQWVAPGPEDLMRVGSTWSWMAEPFGRAPVITADGDPLLMGHTWLEPPWSCFDSLALADPVRSSIWAGPEWGVDFRTKTIPDSSFDSVVGVLENTSYRNRYAASLQRPLPLGLGALISATRDDTLSSQRVELHWRRLRLASDLWQMQDDGYAVRMGASSSSGSLSGDALLGGMAAGEHLWQGRARALYEGLLGGAAGLEAAVAAYEASDSTLAAEAHARAVLRPSSCVGLFLRGDLYLARVSDADGDSLSERALCGAAGLELAPPGIPIMRDALLGVVLPRSGPEETYLLLSATGGPVRLSCEMETSSDPSVRAGVDVYLPPYCRVSVSIRGDTLGAAGALLPGVRFGRALVSAGLGGRVSSADWGRQSPEGHLDLLATFELVSFYLVFAAEDLTDDSNRSYTYGIVWSFSDSPPGAAEAPEGG